MPDRFMRIGSNMSQSARITQINRNFEELDREATRKVFKDTDGTQQISGSLGDGLFGSAITDASGNYIMVQGKLPNGRFGTLYYRDGVPSILIGQSPDNGRMGLWIAKEGENVLTLLGG